MPTSGNKTKISLRVYPSTNRSEVVGFRNGVLQVNVSAPPTKGKANRELIIKGHTNRNKIVAIDGLSQEEVMKRLSSKLFSSGDASR